MRKQLSLNLNRGRHGGRRSGSGRKRIHSKGVAHRSREKVQIRNPLHINFKFRTHIKNKESLRLLKRAIINARRHGLKILHYSMQSNHIHLIIEAINNEVLTKGMRSLTITFAKGLNKGKVQIERYHLHVLKTLRETKNAIHYVLFNQQKHEKGIYSKIDEFSSVLLLKNAVQLIKHYCQMNKVTLLLNRFEDFRMDSAESYLGRTGATEMAPNKFKFLKSDQR